MAVHKTAINTLTVTLTDEERELLESFAAEKGIGELSDAVPAMIHELVQLHDKLWDAQFAQSTAPLDALAREALEAHRKG